MSTILLSIKPEYVGRILEGSKKFEFRKSVAKRKVDCVLIYSTAPVKKVLALVEVTGGPYCCIRPAVLRVHRRIS